MADTIGTYLSGLLLVACFSYLFKENRAFTYAEHLYVGFAAAQAIILGWSNIKQMGLLPLMEGRFILAIPLVLGVLLYARYLKPVSYLSRLPLAFMMGAAAGVTITGVIDAQLVAQVKATMLPMTSLNNAVMVLGTASTLAFFLFIPFRKKAEQGRATNGFGTGAIVQNLGRATIMLAFGSSYGYTVMARLSYLVARLQFLFGRIVPLIPE